MFDCTKCGTTIPLDNVRIERTIDRGSTATSQWDDETHKLKVTCPTCGDLQETINFQKRTLLPVTS